MIFYVLERRLGNIMRVIVVFFKFFLQLFNIGKFYLWAYLIKIIGDKNLNCWYFIPLSNVRLN